jgi:hypothetical protein
MSEQIIGRRFVVFFSLIFIIYIGYYFFGMVRNAKETYSLKIDTLENVVRAEGIIVREEKTIDNSGFVIEGLKNEGEKVFKSEQIAKSVSSSEKEITDKIESVNNEINEALKNDNSSIFSNDIVILNNKIKSCITEMSQTNDISKIKSKKKEIEEYNIKKSKISGDLSASGSYLKELYTKKEGLESSLNQIVKYMYAPISGSLSYKIDGLEDKYTVQNMNTLTKEDISNVQIKSGDVVKTDYSKAKVYNNFYTYIVTAIDNETSKNLKIGQKVKVNMLSFENYYLEIENMITHDNYVIVVFKTTENSNELVNYRKISFDIILWLEEGLKVPNVAILYEGGKAYVLRNRLGVTEKILVKEIRKNDGFVIVGNYTKNELVELGYADDEIKKTKAISEYDEIIMNPFE